MFSVEGHLSLFILYPMIFLILHFWPKSRVEVIETSRVGIFRRLTSFYIDMVVVSFGVYPLICLPILILEYLHTGQWAWSIDREIHSRDILVIPIAIVGFYVMFRYLKWHFDKGKQTLGQHILKFKLIPMEQNGEYAIRFPVACTNIILIPIWPWTIMQKKQDYWWDMLSNIKARRVNKL